MPREYPTGATIFDRSRFKEVPNVDLLFLGDGQLAYLAGLEARRHRLITGVVGSSPENSAGAIADVFFVGDITRGPEMGVGITYAHKVALDTEHIDAGYILTRSDYTSDESKFLFPAPYLKFTQNKRLQHILLRDLGLPLPRFEENILTRGNLEFALRSLGSTSGGGVLQTGSGAYDGRGNAVIHSRYDVEKAWEKLGSKGNLYLEEFVRFDAECALQVARDSEGNVQVFPLVESQHQNGILYLAESGDIQDSEESAEIHSLAQRVSDAIPGIGLLTVELFRVRSQAAYYMNQNFLINEVCIGRPHNSGHHTIDALVTSQNEQIIRLSQGKGLGSTRFRPNVTRSAMLNLIGASVGSKDWQGVEEAQRKFGVSVYNYGKEPRPDRKIGHVNATGTDRSDLRDRLLATLEVLNEANNHLFQVHKLKPIAA